MTSTVGVHERHATYSRRALNLLQQDTIESQASARIIAERLVGRDARCDHTVGLKAWIYVRQSPETSDQKSCANNQQHGKRNFTDCQRSAQTLRHRDCGAPSPRLKRIRRCGARRLKRWSEAEEKTGQDGESGAKGQYAPVHLHIEKPRSVGRQCGFQQRKSQGG